jgi:SpoVK/Ycf46/Vps4 family AAA+-type ATPase
MSFEKELITLLKAKYPLIYIVTQEEERLEYTIRKTIETQLDRVVYSWDFVNGYSDLLNSQSAVKNPFEALNLIETLTPQTPSVIILKDYSRFLSDISVSRKLRNLIKLLRTQPKTLIVISYEKVIPPELEEKFVVLDFKYPKLIEIKKELTRLFALINQDIDSKLFDLIANSCKGLTLDKVRNVITKSIVIKKKINLDTVNLILKEKQQLVGQTEILEFWPTNEGFSDIGGLENLKGWLNKRKLNFSEKALNYGLPIPRGLLLVGVQGTGKSLMAKAIAHDWFLPLLRLDLGRLFAGLVGESESRVRQMIQITESLAPCILWIDEIDKTFSNLNTNGDSGTTNRVISTLITWLAEKKSLVFVVATANSIQNLQLEIIRKGRFDEIFFINLPTKEERKKIFEVHLKHLRPESWENYDIEYLSTMTQNFSGSEIKQLIIEAMYDAFNEKRDFTTEDIFQQIKEIVPLAKLDAESIQNLQNLALSGRIRSASKYN